jgi:heme a synthase
MQKAMLRAAKWALALVFLVILAGSVVRMTGSGMGCPDWPKCFGHFIPPTDADQLAWKPNTAFNKGQMILMDNSFLVANESMVTGNEFDAAMWRKYEKHNYSVFNPLHTWIEYINRLLGALSGIPVLLLFVLSFIGIKQRPGVFALSLFSLMALGFVAWLGKVVVDGNLVPHSITYHMFGAIAVFLPILAIIFILEEKKLPVNLPSDFKWLATLILFLSLVQIYFGTAVREQVDALSPEILRADRIDQLNWIFLVHRSFSIVVLAANGLLIYRAFQIGWGKRLFGGLAILLMVEVLAGVTLNYAGFPAAAQPIHLLCAMGMVALQFYLMLWIWRDSRQQLVAG